VQVVDDADSVSDIFAHSNSTAVSVSDCASKPASENYAAISVAHMSAAVSVPQNSTVASLPQTAAAPDLLKDCKGVDVPKKSAAISVVHKPPVVSVPGKSTVFGFPIYPPVVSALKKDSVSEMFSDLNSDSDSFHILGTVEKVIDWLQKAGNFDDWQETDTDIDVQSLSGKRESDLSSTGHTPTRFKERQKGMRQVIQN
jgi:hypothetical protein